MAVNGMSSINGEKLLKLLKYIGKLLNLNHVFRFCKLVACVLNFGS